ncbi:MAG: DegT/DnrJ/EryC1/StrS family aminotransferase [Chlorobium sp.]|uniref:DegT/DnrJ/EryC1/StrS family aminotransferase n=1 Tax=Chlorobium sp. TaxID=1095 RepID=UPI002F402309
MARTKDNFLVFGSPLIEEDEINDVIACLKSSWIGTGPRVNEFEKAFADYKNVENTAAVNSCTAALHLSLLVSGVGPGDEVITTPLTFCATINAILHTGATPVLADVDRYSFNIDPDKIENKITKRTKAILPVHFAGRPCNMDAICSIAKKNNLIVIEDCAHAIEAEYKNKKTGTFGDFSCFSFYATKNITTGEGGMVVTKSYKDLQRIKTLSLHGMSADAWGRYGDDGYKHYKVVECGYKYNMMDLQAAIGIHQIKKIDEYWERRRILWKRYTDELAGLPIELPSPIQEHEKHAFHLYTILVNEKISGVGRDELINFLTRNEIGVGVHYISIPDHPYYQKIMKWNPFDYPNAKLIGDSTISLPISPKLSDGDVEDVICTLKKRFK